MRTLAGGPLHTEVHDGDGPYVLLVHGMLSSRAQWLLNVDALAAVCRPVVVELLGHGRSPAPDTPHRYTPAAYVDAFAEIHATLGGERWFVVGQSLGAALTLRYTLDHPDAVLAQVFTNSSSALADETWRERIRATAPMTAQRIAAGGHDAIVALPIHPARARHMPDAVQSALVADCEGIDVAGLAHAFLHTVPESSVRDRVGEIRVPTLLVNGRLEAAFAEPRRFAEAHIPKLAVADLDAGHAVNISAADAFNRAVTAFLTANLRQ